MTCECWPGVAGVHELNAVEGEVVVNGDELAVHVLVVVEHLGATDHDADDAEAGVRGRVAPHRIERDALVNRAGDDDDIGGDSADLVLGHGGREAALLRHQELVGKFVGRQPVSRRSPGCQFLEYLGGRVR